MHISSNKIVMVIPWVLGGLLFSDRIHDFIDDIKTDTMGGSGIADN